MGSISPGSQPHILYTSGDHSQRRVENQKRKLPTIGHSATEWALIARAHSDAHRNADMPPCGRLPDRNVL
ncbi:hypothetical protein [Nocardia transvalensis]|uniref:hypothetical protein n=1 Tax=Nocardia transvalensis TaxID=37333 RepID=UPI001895FE3A|nr:hypothetical protein [Nocardia transvalensis]MBF6328702.1 hypothetical protein [Nocardia transvalensis]